MRRNLPAIIVVTLFLVLPSCRYIRERIPFGRHSLNEAFEWAKKDSTRVADSLKRVMPEKKVSEGKLTDSQKRVIKDKKVFEKTLTDSLMSIERENLPEGNPGSHFYIITGSYTNLENAKQAAGQYSRKGYKTTIIKANRDGTRMELVSVKTFSDYNKASLFLKEFKSKYEPRAWIYSGK